MRARFVLLFMISIVLIAASVLLFVFRQDSADYRTLTYDEVLEMSSVTDTYHSINNWETVEDTEFSGVPLYQILEGEEVDDGAAQVKLIASDEYFWPAIGTVLTLDDLKNPNESGLYPLLAYEMNGVVLEAEPDGSGPLRLVMPQYSEDEVNKPSWVSNVRLIEVGPLREGYEAPDPAQVPVDEIWLYGDVAATYRYPLFVPLLVLVAGVLFLLAAAALAIKGRGEGGGGKAAAAVLLAAVLACSGLLALAAASTPCSAGPGGRVFSLAELKSMPAFSGHYTFLKSQEPYTYYEDDYTGVPLSYIIEEEMDLLPGASEVVVRARDNYSKTLSLSQIRAVYPGGLKVIIAYERNSVPLTGDESGLRLVVPQTVPGTREQGGDANTPLCVRMVYALEVLPLPAGEQVPAATSVPVGSLAVYGSVSEPAPTPPAPEPQPEPPPADTPAEAEPGAGEEEQAQPEAEPASGEEEPLSLLETLAQDPLGAFSLNWLLTASIRMQPALAVLPLAAYLDKEGREP